MERDYSFCVQTKTIIEWQKTHTHIHRLYIFCTILKHNMIKKRKQTTKYYSHTRKGIMLIAVEERYFMINLNFISVVQLMEARKYF